MVTFTSPLRLGSLTPSLSRHDGVQPWEKYEDEDEREETDDEVGLEHLQLAQDAPGRHKLVLLPSHSSPRYS